MCTEFSPTGWVLDLSSRSFMGMVKAGWCYLHSGKISVASTTSMNRE